MIKTLIEFFFLNRVHSCLLHPSLEPKLIFERKKRV